jgi:hypothetical protein
MTEEHLDIAFLRALTVARLVPSASYLTKSCACDRGPGTPCFILSADEDLSRASFSRASPRARSRVPPRE